MRNSTLPLYLWIKDKGSILNVNPNSIYSYKLPKRIEVALDVMKRYFRLYKTPVYRASETWYKFQNRYKFSSKYDSFDFLPRNSLHIGFVKSDEYKLYADEAPLAALFRNKFIRKRKELKRKIMPVGSELDLLILTKELEGVIKHEIRLRR